MLTSELQALAEARPVQADYKDSSVAGGYTSDLLSDVMAHAKTGDVLITIQAHKNSVAVAGLVGAPAIILCNNRPIPDDMVEAAREEGIALFSTPLSQFEVSGRLWKALKA
ncbi:MAG: hypothetical protein RBT73_02085 [Spirochaetia bacterium]|jgi:hypothetical protein|nr:hypothetical protein [Spirochaetia bacterium]